MSSAAFLTGTISAVKRPTIGDLLFQRDDISELALVTWSADPAAPKPRQAPTIRKLAAGNPEHAALLRLAAVRFPAGALPFSSQQFGNLPLFPPPIEVAIIPTPEAVGTFRLDYGAFSTPIPVPSTRGVNMVIGFTPALRDERNEVPIAVRWNGQPLPPLRALGPLANRPVALECGATGQEPRGLGGKPGEDALRGQARITRRGR